MRYDFYVFYDCVNKPIIKGYPQEKAQCVFWCNPTKSNVEALMKSIRTAVTELEYPLTTVHKALHKRLRLYAYKVQMLETSAK